MANFYGSYKLRWAILERDKFTCQYCGQMAPNVKLEVDHIIPLTQGGTDDPKNLITSCYACNRGKADALYANGVLKHPHHTTPLLFRLIEYLRSHERATATQISEELKINRGNVSNLLNNAPVFMKVGRQGHGILFTIRDDV